MTPGAFVLTAGCASGLNNSQESELAAYRANNLAVEEKSPGLGAADEIDIKRYTLEKRKVDEKYSATL